LVPLSDTWSGDGLLNVAGGIAIMAEGHSPLDQFKIERLIPIDVGGYDLSITNSTLFMGLAVLLATAFVMLAASPRALVPGRLQSAGEMTYELVAGVIRDNAGTAGMKYFPIIFTIFIFILFTNLLGLVPYAFTVTSHIAVTFTIAFTVFVGITLIGAYKHGFKYLSIFLPSGVPMWLMPLLFVIEVISYMTRPISLSVRLFANMMAGHIMLKVFAGFVVSLGLLAGWAPLAFIVGLTGLELLVAVLQAYVFTILTCIYLNDALHLHH
jgi:F-type H+-transporting ATPase subunit a